MGRGQVIGLALSGVSAYTLCSTAAIHFAGPAMPALVMAAAPLAVVALEAVVRRAPPGRWTAAGSVLAVLGAVLYLWPRPDAEVGVAPALGIAFAVAAMLSMAGYSVWFAHSNAGYSGSTARRILPVFAVGAIPLALWGGAELAMGATVTPLALLSLALLGVVVYVPVYTLQHRILIRAGAAYASLLGLAVPPVVGVGAAVSGLAPWPDAQQWLAGAATLAALGGVLGHRARSRSAAAGV